ncbi:dickkopf-related protein 3 [Pseudopipra pipra]|uniref:dickkopf-related protein 3 n=1 Tax=Pseudopipra pipra TaxID=415032 RepID=UPI00313A0CF5
MEVPRSSDPPLRIKPIQNTERRKVSCLNGKLPLLLSLSIFPFPSASLPLPQHLCPSVLPGVSFSAQGPAACPAPRTPRAGGSSEGCGAGLALRCRRSRPAPPRLRPPAPHRGAAPAGAAAGAAATGMRRGAGPGRRWALLWALLWALCCAAAGGGGGRRRAASLGEMLREVEALMEDTQHKLRNAVQEMEAEEEGAKKLSEVNFENLPPNYHNESDKETRIGNRTVQTHQEIDKVTDNKTGSTVFSETVITSIRDGENKRNHECIIDEDCETGKYCQFSTFEYKCQLCKTQHTPCSRDVECCGDQLCVWGQCRKSTSKGENGTICENQHDCNPGMCCAFQKELLFPVCTPLPEEGEPCHDPSNRLLNLITWDLEPDGVLEQCPCASGLICQPQSHSPTSVCEPSANETRNNEKEDPLIMEEMPFLSLIPRDILSDYEESSVIQEVRRELESLEEQAGLKPEPDSAQDLVLGDEI